MFFKGFYFTIASILSIKSIFKFSKFLFKLLMFMCSIENVESVFVDWSFDLASSTE